jgi:hypothetical protein
MRTSTSGVVGSVGAVAVAALLWLGGCGNQADERGIGAQCTKKEDCAEEEQQCLPFRGGYCGLRDCTKDADCPTGSGCVAHTDGVNYCFRTCQEKAECNRNRAVEVEANCSANVTFVEGALGRKACVPPSST